MYNNPLVSRFTNLDHNALALCETKILDEYNENYSVLVSAWLKCCYLISSSVQLSATSGLLMNIINRSLTERVDHLV